MPLKDYITFLNEEDKYVVLQDTIPADSDETLGLIAGGDPESEKIIRTLKNTLMGKSIVTFIEDRLDKAGFGKIPALVSTLSAAFNKNFNGDANDIVSISKIRNDFPISSPFTLDQVADPYKKFLHQGFFDALYHEAAGFKMAGGAAVGKGEVYLSFLADNLYKGKVGDIQDTSSNYEIEIKGGYGAGFGASGGKGGSGARMGTAEANRDGLTQFKKMLAIIAEVHELKIPIGSAWSKTQNKELGPFFNTLEGSKLLGDTKNLERFVECFTQYSVPIDSACMSDFVPSAKSAEGLNRFMMKMQIYAYWKHSQFDGILFIDEGSKKCYPIMIKSYNDIRAAIETGNFDKSKLEYGNSQQNSSVSITYLG